MPTVTDEVRDIAGVVIKSTPRELSWESPTPQQLKAARVRLRAIVADPLVPAWGKDLARGMLLLTGAIDAVPDVEYVEPLPAPLEAAARALGVKA